ncbi:YceI family protein [Tomitella gaofuii]|uniref:YceI family protein n=1 Tax=Tomitella gaofuii TaxID=2760083 RepID=UPI0015FB0E00|nr:YceI family protein [Tomitella gaofuii]
MTTSVRDAGLTAGTWNLDPVHSSIGFSVRHMMVSKVRGNFDEFTGQITISDEGEATVVADINVGSINTGNDQRDAHVRSADYFEVETHPVATFRSTGIRAKGDAHVLTGEFTLRGVTKPIEMDLELTGINPGTGDGPIAGFEASTVLNRKDFGITLDMPLDGGGAAVGDKITISIDAQARLAA